MRIELDQELCQGHTLCHLAAPDLLGLRDEDGHAVVKVAGTLTTEQEPLARRAEAACPERAICVVD